ncbi:MAG: thioredoxin family protein [Candidatus Omnitrophica bacterium]|nr:thioredoxin family protein [Candidatus Omnitrophota bacterium]
MRANVEIDQAQLRLVLEDLQLPVLVEVMDPFCIICKTMKERLSEVMRGYAGRVIFLRLDINNDLVKEHFKVDAVPTLLYLKKGQVVERQIDFPDKEKIQEVLDRILAA